MAEIADVRFAMASLIRTAAYPTLGDGAAQPGQSAIPGLAGICRVLQSDPKPAEIDEELAAGNALISVTAMQGARSTKRFPPIDQVLAVPMPTLAWTVSGTTATLSGTVSLTVQHNLALIVDGVDFVYQVKTTDTLAGIATAFAALVNAVEPASASGAAITMPDSHKIVARVGVVATTLREVGRQMSRFLVSVWGPTDAIRSAACGLVAGALDDVRRLTLADGSGAWIKAGAEMPAPIDPLKLGVARTNIVHEVEFAKTVAGMAPQAIVWRTGIQGGPAPVSAFTGTSPPVVIVEA